MQLCLHVDREVALLTQERNDILAERNAYQRQLSEALNDLKLRNVEILELKQQYNDVCSELADVKRGLARERLVTAGTGKNDEPAEDAATKLDDSDTGELPLGADSKISVNSNVGADATVSKERSDLAKHCDLSARNDIAVEEDHSPSNGRASSISLLDSQISIASSDIDATEGVEPSREHAPLIENESSGPGQMTPLMREERQSIRNSAPFSATPPTSKELPPPSMLPWDHVPVLAESPKSEAAMEAKDIFKNRYDARSWNYDRVVASALANSINQKTGEKDAQTLKDVVSVICEMAVTGGCSSSICARVCKQMMPNISPEVQDWEERDAEGNTIRGAKLFRKLLLNRCQLDFERWFPKVGKIQEVKSLNNPSDYMNSGTFNWDEEDVSKETVPSTSLPVDLVRFLGELFRVQLLTERIMHECLQTLVPSPGLNRSPYYVEVYIKSLHALLVMVGKALDTSKYRAHMDTYFDRMKKVAWPNPLAPLHESETYDLWSVGLLRDLIDLRERRWSP